MTRCKACGAKAAPGTAHLLGALDQPLCWTCYQARVVALVKRGPLHVAPDTEGPVKPAAVDPELRRIHERLFRKAA